MDNDRPQAVPMEYQTPAEKHPRQPQAIRRRTSQRRTNRRQFLTESGLLATGVVTAGLVASGAEQILQGMRPETERTSARTTPRNARETSLRGLMGKALEPFTNAAQSAWDATGGRVLNNQEQYMRNQINEHHEMIENARRDGNPEIRNQRIQQAEDARKNGI